MHAYFTVYASPYLRKVPRVIKLFPTPRPEFHFDYPNMGAYGGPILFVHGSGGSLPRRIYSGLVCWTYRRHPLTLRRTRLCLKRSLHFLTSRCAACAQPRFSSCTVQAWKEAEQSHAHHPPPSTIAWRLRRSKKESSIRRLGGRFEMQLERPCPRRLRDIEAHFAAPKS